MPEPPATSIPVMPVVRISLQIRISTGMSASQFSASVVSIFSDALAAFGLGDLHFSIRYSGAFASLLGAGRRLEALASGSHGGVQAEVDSAPADLKKVVNSGELAEAAKTAAENEIEGATVTEAYANTLLSDEPDSGYKGSGWGTVCRSDKQDSSIDAQGKAYAVVSKKSVLQCSDECTAKGPNCHAFEYRRSEGRCEIHPAQICHTPPQNMNWFADTPDDFQCFSKRC